MRHHLAFAGILAALVVAGCYDSDSSTKQLDPLTKRPVQRESPRAVELLDRVLTDFRITRRSDVVELTTGAQQLKQESVPFLPPGAARGFVRDRGRLRPFFREQGGQPADLEPSTASPVSKQNSGAASPPASGPSKPAETTLPATADQHFDVRDQVSGLSISVTLRGAQKAEGEVAKGYVVYSSAYAGDADVLHRPHLFGTEEYIAFDSAPPSEEVTYDVALGAGIEGVRAVANSVEFLDRWGTPRLRMAPPFVLGAEETGAWASVTVEGCSVDTSPLPPHGRTRVSPGAQQCALHIAWSGAAIKYPAMLDPAWTLASTMAVARTAAGGARIVVNGRESALVFGGSSFVATTSAAEIYDLATGTWAQTGSMVTGVKLAPSAVLSDGRVFAFGGYRMTPDGAVYDGVQAYNPATGQWTLDGNQGAARMGHTATLLPSGRVLLAGGIGSSAFPLVVNQTAVQYDPSSHLATAAGTMTVERAYHTATLLNNAKILVAGGIGSANLAQSNVDLYDLGTNGWTSGPALPMGGRYFHVASLLPSGQVFVAGGSGPPGSIGQTLQTALYNPAGGTWSTGPNASQSHFMATATVLSLGANAGKVLLAGGDFALSGVELFDPSALSWATIAPLAQGRDGQVSVALQNRVLFAGGGTGDGGVLSSAELYDADAAVAAGSNPVPAPPLDRTVVTTVPMQAQFLYTGASPIQTGVASGTIDPTRAAVVHGKVIDRDTAAPLAGVTVTVVNHPDLGATTTRADGTYYVAVNGGVTYALDFSLTGRLPGRRQISVPPIESVGVRDLALIPAPSGPPSPPFTMSLDGQPVPPGASRLYHGVTSTDSDGQRQLAVYFPPNVTATASGPGGTSQLSTVTVRSLEYTVGQNGAAAMPADLPPTSAFTYAVELTVDQGANATFNPPVPVYVDNFINNPVGIDVPSGYYDRIVAQWIPSTNGRVIKILSVTAGKANLDLDGTGSPASSSALTALGITDAERTELAASYAIGKILWRVPVSHFSTWDFNHGYFPPDGASAGSPGGNVGGPTPLPPCNFGGASTIECESQVLAEDVPVSGTPYRLSYRSDRTLGRKDRYTLKIAATPHVIPGPLVEADVTLSVAGRTFKQAFPPTPDQLFTFTWDGYDAFGRLLQGTQHANVTIDNVYEGVYGRSPQFGSPPTTPGSIGQTRNPLELGGSRTYELGSWDTEGLGLGGWDLDIRHVYDPVQRKIQLGTGSSSLPTQSTSNIIVTLAGGGSGPVSPDGTPALGAKLGTVVDVVVAPDGLVYFSQATCIRRITAAGLLQTIAGDCAGGSGGGPTGFPIAPSFLAFGPSGYLYFSDVTRVRRMNPAESTVMTVAGSDAGSFNGDEIPATSAHLGPTELAIGPDESVYIADSFNGRIRKVTADGIIHTVVGGGTQQFSDGIFATDLSLGGDVIGVALGPDGSLYISKIFSFRVLRVGVDGRVHPFAGTGVSGGLRGDGGPATAASVSSPQDLAVGPDGTVYIEDGQSTVRTVDPAGIINTVAGVPLGACSSADLAPATAACMFFFGFPGIGVGPNGTLYAVDGSLSRIRKIDGAFPGVQTTDIVVPSEDGRQVYVFNFAGRHISTRDAFVTTAPPLHQFAYDSGTGFLSTVSDVDGNVTTILRDGAGHITGVQAPFGQVTAVSLLSDGYIGSITDPASQSTGFTYYPGGLMKTKTSPRGFVSTFFYDAQGRLTQDKDPPEAGGFQSLARIESSTGWIVDRSSRLNRTTHYDISQPSTSSQSTRTNTFPDGHIATIVDRDNGTHTTTLPDGTIISTTDRPDPRFGMGSPVKSTTVQTPSGLIRTETVSRTATLSDPTNLLSLTAATERRDLNGRRYDIVFDPVTRKFTTTSPRGRTTFVTLDAHAHVNSTQIDTLLADQFAFDTRGRLSTVTTGTRVTTHGYHPTSGFLTTITDPLTQVTQLLPDAIGRTTRVTYPDTNFTQLGYDADSNLSAITPPGQPQHIQVFNSVNLLASYQPPAVTGSGTTNTAYAYDFDRALGDVTRPDAITVGHSYDTAGRLQTVTLPTGTITRTYNPTTGQLATIAGPSGETLSFGYDGFLRTSTTFSGPVAGTVSMTYDNDFRVATKAVNANAAIAFGYDTDSLLTSAGAMTLTPGFTGGLLESTSLGGVQDSFGYDSFGDLASHAATASAGSVFSENITLRDALGRIKTKTETVQETSHSYEYTYDTRGRLTDVKIDGVQHAHYAFDGLRGQNGNRSSATIDGVTTNGTYDNQDRLLTYGTATYTYGANGELKTKTVGGQTTTYTYDALGSLLTVALPGGPTIDYVVDGLGRRVGKKVNGTLVKGFLYESQLRVIAELDGSNNLVSEFVYGGKVNVPEYMIRGGVTYRLITDPPRANVV